jgi:hypothetical protein
MKPYSWCLLALCPAVLAACSDEAPPPPEPVVIQIPTAAAPAAATPVAAVETPRKPDLAADVKKALEAASRDIAQGVDVTANGGVVQLFGTVGSEAERREAAKIAGGTAGVISVENRIVVVKGS